MISKNQVQNPAPAPEQNPLLSPNYITAQMNFIFRARLLWRDLASWLRAYMISLYGGVGNTEAINRRLYEIPSEYANIFRVFFGDKPTEQLTTLITQYIAIFQSLIKAQINNDVNAINSLTVQLYKNADDRAALLASVNPYWLKKDWLTYLISYTSMQIEEATTFLTKEYDRNIDIYNRILSLTTLMGDYYSEGLINYFSVRPQESI